MFHSTCGASFNIWSSNGALFVLMALEILARIYGEQIPFNTKNRNMTKYWILSRSCQDNQTILAQIVAVRCVFCLLNLFGQAWISLLNMCIVIKLPKTAHLTCWAVHIIVTICTLWAFPIGRHMAINIIFRFCFNVIQNIIILCITQKTPPKPK